MNLVVCDSSPIRYLVVCQAIALAQELHAKELLMDERAARRVASLQGLVVTGTVGILEKADERGLLNLPEALQRLARTNFRITPEVFRDALQRHAARQSRLPPEPRVEP